MAVSTSSVYLALIIPYFVNLSFLFFSDISLISIFFERMKFWFALLFYYFSVFQFINFCFYLYEFTPFAFPWFILLFFWHLELDVSLSFIFFFISLSINEKTKTPKSNSNSHYGCPSLLPYCWCSGKAYDLSNTAWIRNVEVGHRANPREQFPGWFWFFRLNS